MASAGHKKGVAMAVGSGPDASEFERGCFGRLPIL